MEAATASSCHGGTAGGTLSSYAECGHCRKREKHLPPDTKLKRCRGCSVITYCSKACQKAAWPEHKYACAHGRKSTTGPDEYGEYNSAIALSKAVTIWADVAHHYALEVVANATVTVLSRGGITENFASPNVLVFWLAPYARPGGSKSVADLFRITEVSIEHKDQLRDFTKDWSGLMAQSQKMTDDFRKRYPDVIIFGHIPALFMVGQVATTYFYPIYALHCRKTCALPKWTAPILHDVVFMCVQTMNRGLVLKKLVPCNPCNAFPSAPYAGILVKQKKKWEWLPATSWEWTDASRYNILSGMPLMKIWELYAAM